MFFIFTNSYYRYSSPPFLQPPIVFILPSYPEIFAVVVLVFFFLYLFVWSIPPTYINSPGVFGVLHSWSPQLSWWTKQLWDIRRQGRIKDRTIYASPSFVLLTSSQFFTQKEGHPLEAPEVWSRPVPPPHFLPVSYWVEVSPRSLE